MEEQVAPEQQLREVQERRDAFRSLLNSPGWGLLVEILEAWAEKRMSVLDSEMTSAQDAYKHNTALGELRTLRAVLNLPQQQLEASDDLAEGLKDVLARQKEDEQQEQEVNDNGN